MVAEMLGIPEGTAKSRLRRARRTSATSSAPTSRHGPHEHPYPSRPGRVGPLDADETSLDAPLAEGYGDVVEALASQTAGIAAVGSLRAGRRHT